MKRQTLALTAAAALLLAAACGDATETAGDDGSSVTTVSGTPRKIILGSSARNASSMAEAAGAAVPATGDAALDSRMMMPAAIDFVVAGDLPLLDGPARSWFFPGDATVDLAQVRALAAALGVTGEPVALPADQGGGWRVGPEDGTAASLWVSGGGLHDWYYSPAWNDGSATRGCVYVDPVEPAPDAVATEGGASGEGGAATGSETGTASSGSGVAEPAPAVEPEPKPVDPAVDPSVEEPVTGEDGTVEPPLPVCEEPTPPENVPTADEARAAALDLLTRTGMSVTDARVEVSADEWGAWVTVWTRLGGFELPMPASVGFGANGAVTGASGFVSSPVEGDEYPRVGTTVGLERLHWQNQGWVTIGGGVADLARDAMPCVAEGAPVDPAVSGPVCAEVEPVTVTLTGVREDLTMVWDVDNTVWLLPAYTYTSDDGGLWTVIAVDDAYVDLGTVPVPEPAPLPEPVPVETLPAETTPVETLPTETLPTETTPTESVPPVPEETLPAELTVDQLQTLVGLTEAEAADAAAANGWGFRVVSIDGESLAVTADYSPTRANVTLVDGVVTAATAG